MGRRLLFSVAILIAALSSQSVPGLLASAQAQTATDDEKQAFNAAKELGTVEAWDAFLSNYPKGFHADLAHAYVKKLADAPASPAASSSAEQRFDYPMVAGSWGGIVRSGPGQDYGKVASLKEGEEVTLMAPGEPVKTGDYPWFKISFGNGGKTGFMWGGILCSTGAGRPDLFKLCTFTPVRATSRTTSPREDDDDDRTTKKKTKTAKGGSANCTRHEVYSSSMKQCIPKQAMCEKNEVYSSSLASCMPRM